MTMPRTAVRTRVLDAAARLLHEQGSAAVTTRAVAEAAHTQAPTLYRLFGDKDGLLEAVAEHELARHAADKAAVPATDDPLADLRAAWDRHVGFSLSHPALFGYLVDPDRGARSPAAAAGLEVLRTRVHRLAAAGLLRVPEPTAVALVHAAGTGAVLTLLAVPEDHRDPHLATAMLEAVLQAVLVRAGSASEQLAPAGHPAPAAVPVGAAVTLRAAVPELAALSGAERALLAEWLDRLTAS